MGYQNTIGKGWLTFGDFKDLLLMNPGTRHVDFDNFGELFLNPDLLEIIKYADSRDIMLSCPAGVNFNGVSKEVLEGLVKYRFQYLNISIDGATPDTYSKYRAGGNMVDVINNIRIINQYKKQYRSQYPKMQWQFIVFGHNEDEIKDARAMAESLGMSFYPKLNWNSEYSPIRNRENVARETGWTVFTREEYEQQTGLSYVRPTCYSLWTGPRYSWDLSVTGCCWNVWERFTPSGITWAKKMLTDSRFTALGSIPCTNCEIYKGLQRTGKGLTKLEILKHGARTRARTEVAYWLWRLNR